MGQKGTGKGLGRGLEALFGEAAAENAPAAPESGSILLRLTDVEPNRAQPRKSFDDESLNELAESIRQHGILQPLMVRRLPSGYYQIIAGERRWRAARLAGLEKVPAILVEADDLHANELALIENLQREDLNPVEEAEGFRTLVTGFGLTQEEVSARVGKSRPAIANALRLLGLEPEVLERLSKGELSTGHARALLSLSKLEQKNVAAKVVKDGLSVRQLENLVRKLIEMRNREEKKDSALSVNYLEQIEKELSASAGRKVHIVKGKKRGRIELEFYGDEDLEKLIEGLSRL